MSFSATPKTVPDFISSQVVSARRFYLDLKAKSRRGLRVVCGGVEEVSADYVIDRRTFPFYGLEFVARGAGELRLGGRRHQLGPGSVFVYSPGVPHRIRTFPETPLVKYFVDFTGSDAAHLVRACGLAGGFTSVAAIGEVREGFEELLRLGLQRDARTERSCALRLELLLHAIARSRQGGRAVHRRARATFERVRQCLDTRFFELASIAEVSAACHLDPSHLARVFRRFQNETPLKYLLRRRMQWAAERLETGDRLVRQVADELGTDAFTFSRTFKRVHGIPPQDFLALRSRHSF